MKTNILQTSIDTDTLDDYALSISSKLGQAVNPTSDVTFNDLNISGNIVTQQDIICQSGIIVGNVVSTNASGVSVSSPSLSTSIIDGISTITQIVAELLVVSASYATLECSFSLTTGPFNNTQNLSVFNIFLPGIQQFTSTNLNTFCFTGTGWDVTNFAPIDQMVAIGLENTRQVQISSLVALQPNQTYTIQLRFGYAFTPVPNQFTFTRNNLSSGLDPSSYNSTISFLLTTIANNQVQLSFTINGARFNYIESIDFVLPNRATPFTNSGQVSGILQGVDTVSGYTLDGCIVKANVGTTNATIQFLATATTMRLNLFLVYLGE